MPSPVIAATWYAPSERITVILLLLRRHDRKYCGSRSLSKLEPDRVDASTAFPQVCHARGLRSRPSVNGLSPKTFKSHPDGEILPQFQAHPHAHSHGKSRTETGAASDGDLLDRLIASHCEPPQKHAPKPSCADPAPPAQRHAHAQRCLTRSHAPESATQSALKRRAEENGAIPLTDAEEASGKPPGPAAVGVRVLSLTKPRQLIPTGRQRSTPRSVLRESQHPGLSLSNGVSGRTG